MFVFKVNPVAKPRMTRSDKWKSRPATAHYWQFKDELNVQAAKQGFNIGKQISVVFLLPMPASWSQKKKDLMDGTSHEQKPDTDNLLKAFCDALTDNDCAIWSQTGRKFWAYQGRIVVVQNDVYTTRINSLAELAL